MPTITASLVYSSIDSPIGELLMLGDGHALRGLFMQEGRRPVTVERDWEPADEPFADLREQLAEYFAGERTTFAVTLAMDGSPFQHTVWRALQEIPYGSTISYGELAGRVGKPSAARAVGLANGRNPIAIVVPCHRVIGANGDLTGYGGGIERKRHLLALEADGLTRHGSEHAGRLEPGRERVSADRARLRTPTGRP